MCCGRTGDWFYSTWRVVIGRCASRAAWSDLARKSQTITSTRGPGRARLAHTSASRAQSSRADRYVHVSQQNTVVESLNVQHLSQLKQKKVQTWAVLLVQFFEFLKIRTSAVLSLYSSIALRALLYWISTAFLHFSHWCKRVMCNVGFSLLAFKSAFFLTCYVKIGVL